MSWDVRVAESADAADAARLIAFVAGQPTGHLYQYPLLDRIDLHVEVPAVKFREITADHTGEPSAKIRERVVAARRRQLARLGPNSRITCNARLGSKELKVHCALDETTLELLKHALNDMNLSARAYDRILKVARTIADLAESERITSEHVSEAVQFRSLDRQLWK